MFCYVGKATKIFLFVVSMVAVTGLVVGFGVLRRHHAGGPHGNTWGATPPRPIPATATSAPPLLSPPAPFSGSLSGAPASS